MKTPFQHNEKTNRLSDKEFNILSEYIQREFGIKMPIEKKVMLEGRLQKRLRAREIESFKEYCDYLFSEKGMNEEVFGFINVVSTNKTEFFREPAQFEFLKTSLQSQIKENQYQPLKIWSAACSSGEEPYTIAMVILEQGDANMIPNYSILATDISTEMLNKAKKAIYKYDSVSNIPLEIKRKYLLKSKDTDNAMVRIVPEIRNKIRFDSLNLMSDRYNVPKDLDMIFCRNVLIYFEFEIQAKVIKRLCEHLKKGGYLFLGHSESIINLDVPLKQIQPSVFRKV